MEIMIETGGINNEFFGESYTGTNWVPEPATMLLLGSNPVGISGLRRKLRKR